jgi:hypothetical protein
MGRIRLASRRTLHPLKTDGGSPLLYRAYKYLYYRIYAWNLRAWGESDLPQYNALFVVTILVGMNLLTIPTAIDAFTGGNIMPNTNATRIGFFLVFGAVMAVGYFCLVHKENFKTIAKEFASESLTQRRIRLLAVWIYLIGSFAAFFGLMSFVHR